MSESKKRRTNDGYTAAQRRWIKNRDKNQCALCGSTEKLEVHHIVPFRYSMNVLRWTFTQTNSPTNGITICQYDHRGSENAIHPDIARAGQLYGSDKQIYSKLFAKRDELCRSGMVYWSVGKDSLMSEIAIRNTLCYVASGAPIDVWTDGKDWGVPKFPLTEEDIEDDVIPLKSKKEVSNEEAKPAIIHKDISIITVPVQSLSQFLARNKE